MAIARRVFLTACALLGGCIADVPTEEGVAHLETPCLVSTVNGDVQGTDLGASCGFLGLPYAASTAGANRWKPPQPRASWAPTVFNANLPNVQCAQLSQTGTPTGTEDCLIMNIWAPDPLPASAPVIVWFPTGAFTAAGAGFAPANGRRFAEETGAIIVAANYRLGAFGWLAHNALAAEDPARPSSGNYGLLDQQAALLWVQENIAQFGGNPDKVTIAGTSAGGLSVGLQLVSPSSVGLYNRAIIQSAYPTSRLTTHAGAVVQGTTFSNALACTDPDPAILLSCLRGKTSAQIMTALLQGNQQVVPAAGRAYWEPIVDGIVIPDQPRALFASGEFNLVRTIIGVNRDEGWGSFITRSFPTAVTLAQYQTWVTNEFGADAAAVLAQYPAASYSSPQEAMARVVGDGQFTCEARRLSSLISSMPSGKVYQYSYEYELDDLSLNHVNHGFESNILFGNNYATPQFPVNHALTANDNELHTQMEGYWLRFAATGDPNGDSDGDEAAAGDEDADADFSCDGDDDDDFCNFEEWKKYKDVQPRYLVLDSRIKRDANLGDGACDFWSGYDFGSMLSSQPASSPL